LKRRRKLAERVGFEFTSDKETKEFAVQPGLRFEKKGRESLVPP
jgi:hypothetical protein